MWPQMIFALVVAIILTSIFWVGFKTRGPWGRFWVFFLILFLVSWGGGLWVTPFGPLLWGVYWVPIVTVGLIFALLLAASHPQRPPLTLREAREQAEEEKEAEVAFSVFFWIFILILAGIIIVRYIPFPNTLTMAV